MKPIKWIVLFALLPLTGCEFNQLAGPTGGYTVPSSSSAGASSAMTAGTFTSSGNFATSSSAPELPDYTDPATGVIYRGDSTMGVYWASGIDKSISATNFSLLTQVNGVNVHGIANGAFSGQLSVTDLIIPDNYVEIKDFAFAYSPSIQKVALPEKLAGLGRAVFADCPNLYSLNISSNNPNYKTSDGGLGLYSKDGSCLYAVALGSLPSFAVPDGVTWLSPYLFYQWSSLTNVSLPEGLNSIETDTFSGTGLTSIALPSTISTITGNPFQACYQLQSFSFPQGNVYYGTDGACLYRIDNHCLQSFAPAAAGSGTYTVPSFITSIGSSAFQYASFTQIVFPGSLVSIDDAAFLASSLTSIELPSTLSALGTGVFKLCGSLGKADLSASSLNYLPDGTFTGDQNLESVALPLTLMGLGASCFQDDVKLAALDLPKTIINIDAACFLNATGLKKLSYAASIADWLKITCGENWRTGTGLLDVTCADGSVAL